MIFHLYFSLPISFLFIVSLTFAADVELTILTNKDGALCRLVEKSDSNVNDAYIKLLVNESITGHKISALIFRYDDLVNFYLFLHLKQSVNCIPRTKPNCIRTCWMMMEGLLTSMLPRVNQLITWCFGVGHLIKMLSFQSLMLQDIASTLLHCWQLDWNSNCPSSSTKVTTV